ncbi:uncharacterized protein N7482_009050 [Penicillium canariense]|uniref:Uncharacterized protein n=1 Tax=Penicillium canariense TaxID=189055 RepID=A0A9W9LFN7_9EURO|nr:uncharacterized protein N7482_009050 [Penicillium canariense]KAJ5152572.1 hypothetical protein N7482_009050 [Penicillium canariense]
MGLAPLFSVFSSFGPFGPPNAFNVPQNPRLLDGSAQMQQRGPTIVAIRRHRRGNLINFDFVPRWGYSPGLAQTKFPVVAEGVGTSYRGGSALGALIDLLLMDLCGQPEEEPPHRAVALLYPSLIRLFLVSCVCFTGACDHTVSASRTAQVCPGWALGKRPQDVPRRQEGGEGHSTGAKLGKPWGIAGRGKHAAAWRGDQAFDGRLEFRSTLDANRSEIALDRVSVRDHPNPVGREYGAPDSPVLVRTDFSGLELSSEATVDPSQGIPFHIFFVDLTSQTLLSADAGRCGLHATRFFAGHRQ